jgi:hypothetical protein
MSADAPCPTTIAATTASDAPAVSTPTATVGAVGAERYNILPPASGTEEPFRLRTPSDSLIVLVTGNVLLGITLWGPFVSIDAARSWADAQGLDESWTTRMFSPESVEGHVLVPAERSEKGMKR